MSYRVAKSLDKLLAQLNTLFPNRSKISDGSVGDLKHSKRKSDHNPNSANVVTARDFTFDTDPSDGEGINCHALALALFNSKDPRIKYIIWNGRITKEDKSGWKTYSGPNPHKHHLHLSVSSNPALYDDDSDWNLDLEFTAMSSKVPGPPKNGRPVLQRGAKNSYVSQLQHKLFVFGYLKQTDIDSDFGVRTESAVQRFQMDKGLIADGVVGPKTWEALG